MQAPEPAPAAWRDRAVAARSRRRRQAGLLLVLAAVSLALLAWGQTNPAHSLVVHDVLARPILWALVAAGLAVAGVAGMVDDPHRRVIVFVLAGGVVATCFGLVGLVVSSQVSRDRATWQVPGPRGLVAVVDDDGDAVHPVTRVHVQGAAWSMTAQRHLVACVQAPTPDPGARQRARVRWASPTNLVVEAAGHSYAVTVDEHGAPEHTARSGLLCR